MLSLKNNSYCSRNSKNKNMTYGIVGLGRFGSALAMDLASAGAEIVVMDKNEERVRTLREMTEHAYVVANLDKKTLIETGIQNCDVAIVCIAEHLFQELLPKQQPQSMGLFLRNWERKLFFLNGIWPSALQAALKIHIISI